MLLRTYTLLCKFSEGGQKFTCLLSDAQAQHWLTYQSLKALTFVQDEGFMAVS